MRRTIVLIAALATSACGGPGEGKEVKDSLAAFATASETSDGTDFCKGLTPESRRLFDALGRGYLGEGGDCAGYLREESGDRGDYSISQELSAAIDEADVDIDGDSARVKVGDGERVPLRKVGGEWLVDLANTRTRGYGLRGSAACTASRVDDIERPLPRPTRAGLAADIRADVRHLTSLLRAVERSDPPSERETEHERFVRMLRQNIATWERTAKAMRGLGSPIETYNKGLSETEKRARATSKDQERLGLGCLGNAQGLIDAESYLEDANRVCTAAGRRVERLSDSAPPSAYARLVRDTATKLSGLLEVPDPLVELHRRTASAYRNTARALTRAGADEAAAAERFELTALRAAVGFFRLGLPKCAEL
jgi:hypothetical protein